MKKTILISALVATGLSTAAFAQEAGTPSPMSPDATTPATAAPAAPGAMTPATTLSTGATEPAILLDQQVDGQRLSSALIGAAVYSTTGEHIGDIKDIIIDARGAARGYLVGVGGFLGVGEKDVALSYGAVTSSVDDGGNPRLVVNLTKETLTDAPAFKSTDRS